MKPLVAVRALFARLTVSRRRARRVKALEDRLAKLVAARLECGDRKPPLPNR